MKKVFSKRWFRVCHVLFYKTPYGRPAKFLAARVGTTIIQSCEVFGFIVYDIDR